MADPAEIRQRSSREAALEALGRIRPPLLLQLIYATIFVLVATILAIWIIANQLSAGFGLVLAERYGVEASVAHQMFMDSLHFAFIRVGAGAVILAVAASVLLLRNILRPLREMTLQIERVTAGDFAARIDIAGMPPRCEIRLLGAALNKMAEKLDGLERLRRQMVSNLAHDLLTPLTNLRGYLEGLRDGVVEVTDDVFSMLEGEIRRLVRLVEDLHQLAIVDSSKVKITFEKFDIAELVNEAATIFETDFEKRRLTMQLHAADDARHMTADREKVLRIVRNFLQNAARYADENTIVDIRVQKVGAFIEVACLNMGAEIPESDLPYIFDRFYRARTSDSHPEGGAGLGLAIVKELAEAHGGSVGAKSRAGKTEIWVRLPIMPPHSKDGR
jgi:signal transduction histidine kinase